MSRKLQTDRPCKQANDNTMKLYLNAVNSHLIEVLDKLMQAPLFNDFILVGGTSLALQRGHRRSIDIDMFTALPYGDMPLVEIKDWFVENFETHEGVELLAEVRPGYNIYVANGDAPRIKVDLFYADEFLFPPVVEGIFRMADERDIAAMKLLAISGNIKRQKDYWDIHELMNSYTLNQMIDWTLQRYPYLTRSEIIDGLHAVDAVEESYEGIVALRPLEYWELNVMDIKEALARL